MWKPTSSAGDPALINVGRWTSKPAPKTMKETFWSKLGELWAIRRRCQGIKLPQRQNRRMRSREFCDETQRLAKIVLPKRHPLRPTGQSAWFSSRRRAENFSPKFPVVTYKISAIDRVYDSPVDSVALGPAVLMDVTATPFGRIWVQSRIISGLIWHVF